MAVFGFNSPNNNAPLPPFITTNPTGGNTNMYGGSEGADFPSFSLYGNPNTGVSSPMANMPLFSGASGSPLAGLNSGFNFWGQGDLSTNLYNSLGKAYGKGMGALIGHDLTAGLYNPQVAAAFLNAMQPSLNKGEGDILSSFGAEGSRFGSAAALGLGNYESQFNLNEQQTLASMYMQAQQEQLGLLENVMPTMHAERANSGGVLSDILGGLEIAGGAIAAPFTGGLSLGLVGSGVGTIMGGNSGGGATGGNPLGGISPIQGTPGIPWSTPPFAPSTSPSANQSFWQQYNMDALSASGGNAITGDTSDGGWGDLNEYLMQPGGTK